MQPNVKRIDYYPFGSSLKTRGFSVGSGFRFGFNGKENFDKYQDYGFRIYNPELGKFLSVDPMNKTFAWNSTFAFSENRPIDGVDLEGLEYVSAVNWANKNIGNYSIPFMFEKKWPPLFNQLKQSNWKDVINGSMYCATSTALCYAQANPKVADYLSKNNYQTNRISGQLEFFQKGGKYHSLIPSNQFIKATGGDLIFMQSTTDEGEMSGHVALLESYPMPKGDPGITNSNIDKIMPVGSYLINVLTTNAGVSSTQPDGSQVNNTFGLAGYIIEQRSDEGYYLKGKFESTNISFDKNGKLNRQIIFEDMSNENQKIQGFGRVEESKIDK